MTTLALVIKVRGVDGQERRYAYRDSPISIGRSPLADLQLTESFVSRWEGTLRFDERSLTYFALGSTNPALVDGRAMDMREQDVPIGINSVLAIGELELRFAREPVDDANLKKRGGRKVAQDARHVEAKTVFLDRSIEEALEVALRTIAISKPAQPTPSPGSSGSGTARARSTPPPLPPRGAPLDGDAFATVWSPPPFAAAEKTHAASLDALYAAYRVSAGELLRDVTERLVHTPESEREALAQAIQQHYPALADDPDYRALLGRLGLPAPSSGVEQVREWLSGIGKDVFPESLKLDDQQTLGRILRLLELFAQSLAEIHSAQDAVRSRWLGRSSRRSLVRSENGRVALAYLLNPTADWEARIAELEQTVRYAVTHELALFRATLEGARKLIDSLSPAALEQASSALEAAPRGFFARLFGRAPPHESRLWQRLVSKYDELIDGQRYQRVFLGRPFALCYLAAMGQKDDLDPSRVNDRSSVSLPPTSTMRGMAG